MLEKMWRKGNTPLMLVEMQSCTATLEISVALSQKIGNPPTSRPSNTTPWHITKSCSTTPQVHLLNHVHRSIICYSQNLEIPRCPAIEEWIKKMWYNYTIEYYAAVKDNIIMKFIDKWMDLENKYHPE